MGAKVAADEVEMRKEKAAPKYYCSNEMAMWCHVVHYKPGTCSTKNQEDAALSAESAAQKEESETSKKANKDLLKEGEGYTEELKDKGEKNITKRDTKLAKDTIEIREAADDRTREQAKDKDLKKLEKDERREAEADQTARHDEQKIAHDRKEEKKLHDKIKYENVDED